MKKVLICVNSLGKGGSERQIFLLASSLKQRFQVHIFSLGGGYFHDKLLAFDIPVSVYTRSHKFDLYPFRKLQELIQSFQPDIVHSWDWMQTIATAHLCKTKSIGLVSGFIRTGRIPPKAWLGMLIGSRISNITIANSQAGFDAFKLRQNDKVIYNGINHKSFAKEKSDNFPPLICTMCASFLPSKDHVSIFKAANYYSNKNFQFILAGQGPLYDSLKSSNMHLIQNKNARLC